MIHGCVRWISFIFVLKIGKQMIFKQKKGPALDPQQHELLEHAQRRIRQKKRLYRHFVILLIGCVFLIVVNKVLKYGETHDWYLWAITLWAFLFAIHFVQVFLLDPFMGKEWERAQREKLLRKQQERIRKMEKEIESSHPLPKLPKNPELPKKKDL
jgi:hypothetical protein